jgi:tetraacyldisaccharide 4'-kinase
LIANDGILKVSQDDAGDEPAMMAKAFNGPIAVARRRIHAVELLRSLGPLDVVLLDDAFQHLRLERDLDLVLVNDDRGFGNGWLLPAGPMREPISAVRRADAIILISSGGRGSALLPLEVKILESRALLHASLRPRVLIASENGSWRELPLTLAGRRVLAVSGLASPAGFHAMLRGAGADVIRVVEYPDHHAYRDADWNAIVEASRLADLIVTTEKDLVKLERFPFVRDSLYALRLEVTMEPADASALDNLIFSRVKPLA